MITQEKIRTARQDYGTRVRDARRFAEITQGELAEMLGVASVVVAALENGRYTLRSYAQSLLVRTLPALAD
jgi:ribosome-binding protein aMBF1 (putative translation factor)